MTSTAQTNSLEKLANTTSDTSLQPSVDIKGNQHGFGSHRALKSATGSAAVPPALKTTEPLADKVVTESPSSTDHQQGTSAAINRMSIAPSLGGNSLISQYSPFIGQAKEVPVAVTSEASVAPAPAETQNPAADNRLAVDKIRSSTNELESLLSDMKALRKTSGPLSTAPNWVNVPPSPSSASSGQAAARPGPSHSTPQPSTTFTPTPSATVTALPSQQLAPDSESPSLDSAFATQHRFRFGPPAFGKEPSAPDSFGHNTVFNHRNQRPPSFHQADHGADQFRYSPHFGAQVPQKSGLRTEVHMRSTSMPVRFAANDDVIENAQPSDSTDSESTALAQSKNAEPLREPVNRDSYNFPSREETGRFDSTKDHTFELPSLTRQPSLGESIALASGPLTGLEQMPAPPFLAKFDGRESTSNLDSSTESYKTAQSQTDGSDAEELQLGTSAGSTVGIASSSPTTPANTYQRSVSSPGQSTTTPTGYRRGTPFTDLTEFNPNLPQLHSTTSSVSGPSLLSPAAVIATRENKSTTSTPTPRQGHHRTVSSPLLSHMPLPPPSISGSSLRDSVISLGHNPQRSFDSSVSDNSRFGDEGTLRPGQALGDISENQEPSPQNARLSEASGTLSNESDTIAFGPRFPSGSSGRGDLPVVTEVGPMSTTASTITAAATAAAAPIIFPVASELNRSKTTGSTSTRHRTSGTSGSYRTSADTYVGDRRTSHKRRDTRDSRRSSGVPPASRISANTNDSAQNELDQYLNRQQQHIHHRQQPSQSQSRHSEQSQVPLDFDYDESLLPAAPPTMRFSKRSSKSQPFSNPTVQKLMDLSDSTFRLEDIDMPPTERQLIEKFVNAVAKLSVDISDDKNKRPEGIRRLHNALRAIEGWI